jgi:hypothetical protein
MASIEHMKNCVLYSIVRILDDEKVFVNYNTLKSLPVLENHLNKYANLCPDAVWKHEQYFSGPDAEAKKMTFMSKPVIKKAMENYIEKFLTVQVGPMPTPPAWEDLTPDNPPNLNILFMPQKGRSRTRKQKRKQSRKQKQVRCN